MAKRKNRTIRKRVKTAKSQTEFIADIRDESDEIEEAMLRRANRFNDNISNIDVNDEEEL